MSNELRNNYPRLVESNYTIDPNLDGHLIVRAVGGDVTITLPEASTLPSIGRTYTTRVCITWDSDSNCIVETTGSDIFQQGFSQLVISVPGEAVEVCGINDPDYTGAVAWKQTSKKTIYATYQITSPITGFNERIESNPLIVPFDVINTSNTQIFSLTNNTEMTQGISTLVEAQYYLSFDSIFDNTYVIEAYLRKNGADIIDESKTYVGNFGGEDINLTSAMQYLEVSPWDYFELVVFHDGGIVDPSSNVNRVYVTMKTVIN